MRSSSGAIARNYSQRRRRARSRASLPVEGVVTIDLESSGVIRRIIELTPRESTPVEINYGKTIGEQVRQGSVDSAVTVAPGNEQARWAGPTNFVEKFGPVDSRGLHVQTARHGWFWPARVLYQPRRF